MNVKIHRYGFEIEFDINRIHSGFYWIAKNKKLEENGFIDYSLFHKKGYFFIETTFTPLAVDIIPIYSISKKLSVEPSIIYTGKWILSFVNLKQSSSTIQILAAKQQSYNGQVLISSIKLDEIKTCNYEIQTNDVYDKFFVKKSNYSEQEIILTNFSLSKEKTNQMLITDESLIKPEYEHISRKDNKIIFDSKAPIWSFFTMQFCEI